MEHKTGAKPIIIGVLGVVVLAAVFVIFSSLIGPQIKLTFGDNSFNAKAILNDTDRNKILLGGIDTDSDKIILAFPVDGNYSVSMNNVSKPIDILWLDKDKRVIYIVKNTSSSVGTNSSYKPKMESRFIVELPPGSVDGYEIKINQIAEFNLKTEDIK